MSLGHVSRLVVSVAVAGLFGGSWAQADTADQCAVVSEPVNTETFEETRAQARVLLAQATTPERQRKPAATSTLSTGDYKREIGAARSEARKVQSQVKASDSRVERAKKDAFAALQKVANYSGSDPKEMQRLLDQVDRNAERLQKAIQGERPELAGAFECNGKRQDCKEDCQAKKGKACCCGCGMSYLACIFLG